jgi:hypothetical protein
MLVEAMTAHGGLPGETRLHLTRLVVEGAPAALEESAGD